MLIFKSLASTTRVSKVHKVIDWFMTSYMNLSIPQTDGARQKNQHTNRTPKSLPQPSLSIWIFLLHSLCHCYNKHKPVNQSIATIFQFNLTQKKNHKNLVHWWWCSGNSLNQIYQRLGGIARNSPLQIISTKNKNEENILGWNRYNMFETRRNSMVHNSNTTTCCSSK